MCGAAAMLATVDRLLTDATPAHNRGRISNRDSIHQLIQLLPHLSEAQQIGALRRIKLLLGRSLFNLHVCTFGLQLVTVMLRWLASDASPLPSAVLDEVLEVLAVLGGYRATPQELRTLFELLQAAMVPSFESGCWTASD